MRLPCLFAAFVVLPLAGCETETEPRVAADPFMVAEVSGQVSATHSGPADFYAGYHRRWGIDRISVSSNDTLSSGPEGGADRSAFFQLLGSQSFPEGERIPIVNIDPERSDELGLTARYRNFRDHYVAAEGEMIVIESSDSLVRGTFWLRGFRYEDYPIPASPPEDAEWIEVEGDFLATPQPPPELFPGGG